MKIANLINDRGNRAVNQFVITHGDYVYFQSYETMIGRYNKVTGEMLITHDWDCSATTRKHFYIWLADYTPFWNKRERVLENIKNGVFKVVSEKEITI